MADAVTPALARLASQFKTKDNVKSLVQAFVSEFGELEDVFVDLFTDRWITTAVGIQLDLLGDILGQPRVSLDDETYRILLSLRIGRNRSRGTPDEVIQWFSFLVSLLITGTIEVPPSIPTKFEELFPAFVLLTMVTDTVISDFNQGIISQEIDAVAPAGVAVQAKVEPATNPFRYDGPGVPITAGYDDGFGNGGAYGYVFS